MLLIKAAKYKRLISQISSFAFSKSSAYLQLSRLNHEIQNTRNWSQFYRLFRENKESFNEEVFDLSSKFINQLLSKQKQNIKNSQFQELIAVIQNFDVSTLTQGKILSILALLRHFCMKGIEMHTIYKLKYKLCSRCTDIITKKPAGKENISELIYFYYEMAYFRWQPGTKFISEKIMNRINKQPQNASILTLNQFLFLLKALAIKGDLTSYERKLRFYILKTMTSKLDLFKLHDLVGCLISLNKLDSYDFTTQQFLFVKILGNKMLENISELQQKSTFDFLKGDHNNEHPIFYRIYEELIKLTYRQIQQDGNASFDQKTVLRLISLLSSRYNFNNHTTLQKKKFYNFLKNAAKHFADKNDIQSTHQLHAYIEGMLRNRYIDISKNQELIEILLKGNIPLRYSLLDVLYNNRVDIREFLPTSQKYLYQNSSLTTIIKVSSFLRKVAMNPIYQAQVKNIDSYLSSIAKRIQSFFQSPENFTNVFSNLFRNTDLGINFRLFHETHDYFSRLLNPFQLDESATTLFYKIAYLNYVVKAFKARDFYKFSRDYNQKISNLVIAKLVSNNLSEDSRKIEPNKYIVHLVQINLLVAIEQKDRDFIMASFEMLSKYNRYIVCNNRDFELARNVQKILISYLNKIQSLKEAGFINNFLPVFGKYITRNAGTYKNEQIFRDLLIHSLQIIDKLPLHLVTQLSRQGLRLNLLEKKIIEKIDLSKLNGLSYFEKQAIAYIQDNSKVLSIKKITSGSLPYILANHNLFNFIQEKQTQICEVVQKTFIDSCISCLTNFNQPLNKVTTKILAKILENVNSKNFTIQRSDFQGAMNNLIHKGFTNVIGVRQFAEKVITHLNNKIGYYSLWTHTEAIRFIISIPNFNPKEYYSRLVDYTEKFYSELDLQELIYKLSFTNYQFRTQDLKYVHSILKKNIFKGTYLFLATENMHSESDRKIIVSEIVRRLKQAKEDQVNIRDIQYEYLKRAYPQETKDLNLKAQQLQKGVYFFKPRAKIINVLQKLAEHNKVNLQYLQSFEQNYIFKIKNLCICFISSKKQGSVHQHEVLKKALNLYHKDQGYTFMLSGTSSIIKISEQIQICAPELITAEFKHQIAQMFQKQKEKIGQEQSQQKRENVQPKHQDK